MHKLTAIKERIQTHVVLPGVLQSPWRWARALNLPAGFSAGCPPEHRACHDRGPKGLKNKRPWARKAKRNLSTCALTCEDNSDRKRAFMFLKTAELHKRNINGTFKNLTAAPESHYYYESGEKGKCEGFLTVLGTL